jgi:hypothetical protein
MSKVTLNGMSYTMEDLERLASIGTFNQYTGAILGLIHHTKMLAAENAKLKVSASRAESYEAQLIAIRTEIENLKKK